MHPHATRPPSRRRRPGHGRRHGLVLAVTTFAATTLALVPVVGASAAGPTLVAADVAALAADPGTPGVPRQPVVLYEEDFEQGTGVVPLTDLVGPQGVTYTADPYWLAVEHCNGFVTSASEPWPGTGWCDEEYQYALVQAKTYALGLLGDGVAPERNRALSTNSNPDRTVPFSPGEVEFRTAGTLALPSATGRFVTFSVDAAATDCVEAHPLLRFWFTDGVDEVPVSDQPIDPCVDGDRRVHAPGVGLPETPENEVFYGSFAADSSILFDGAPFGIVLRNEATDISGNDGAVDDIRVLDVTPRLDVAATPAVVATGGTATLGWTVTNTAELAAKDGWRFESTLPDGLVLAGDPVTDCPATTVTTTGGAVVTVDGHLDADVVACAITAPVTAAAPGTYAFTPSATTVTGLDGPSAGALVVADAGLGLVAQVGPVTDVDGDGRPSAGDTAPWTYTVTNAGGVTLTGVSVTDPAVGVVGCPAEPLVPGASATCTAVRVLTAEDLAAGAVTGTAVATGVPVGGGSVRSAPAVTTLALPVVPPGPAQQPVPGAEPAPGVTAAPASTGSEVRPAPGRFLAVTGDPAALSLAGIGGLLLLVGASVLVARGRRA